jgi:rubrerythrin
MDEASQPNEPRLGVPPDPPWKPLESGDHPPKGYLSVYYSDPLARYPVRHITKVGDNKSDPNIETATYGLFSTCEKELRRSIVKNKRPWIFFVANLKGAGRALTGFYEVGWYAPGPLGKRDFALAASRMRFIDPIPLSEIAGPLGDKVRIRFRLYMGVDEEETEALRNLVEERSDRTEAYLREVRRMESYSKRITGYSYPTWEREGSFSPADAAIYLEHPESPDDEEIGNTSPTDRWKCSECGHELVNLSRQKLCPSCQRTGTLSAVQS